MKMNTQYPKPMRHSEGTSERQIHSEQDYLKNIETFQINNIILQLQELEEQQTKPRLSRRKEIKSDFKNLTLYWRPGRYFKDLIKLMSYDLKDERW